MNENKKMPLVPLIGITVFPNMVISFSVAREKSLNAVKEAQKTSNFLYLITQKDANVIVPERKDLYDVGTIAEIKQVLSLPGNVTHIIVEGIKCGKLLELISQDDFDFAIFEELQYDFEIDINNEVEALMRTAIDYFEEYLKLNAKPITNETMINILSAPKPGQLADLIATGINVSNEKKQKILEEINPIKRLKIIIEILIVELDILRIKKKIDEDVKKKIDETQKQYYLREQIRVIQKELGDKDGIAEDVNKYKKLLDEKQLPSQSKEIIMREIDKFSRMPITSPDSNVLRNYIEWVLSLPWNKYTQEKSTIKNAEKILNREHYGLEKVKERIIEYIAVLKANVENPTIICLSGPPGVGKTSIARSVAKALGRKYVRMSLGGMKDEAEIRGHRKTYIGAMPGRIIKAIREAGSSNPLILLDEVDKLSSSYNGDPSSALLEVLDSEQNNTFRDNYIEIPYDLSKVIFMCTANTLDTIPSALKDRMEIITLSSYTFEEKKHIAMEYLYPKELKRHGLTKTKLKITPEAFDEIIDFYTAEAGVRQLERIIGKLCRKTVKIIISQEKKSVLITPENIEQYLGKRLSYRDKIYDEPQIGIVRGLAWTQFGGDTLSIEVNTMKGTGKFHLTGKLGDVMKESAMAAMSYIRSQSEEFKLDDNFYNEKDIHIHIPEGAVPKDGPSAGITMATAMISALKGVKIRNDVAMTGEITIRGRVLPIGGLKEKIIAAKKSGIKKIIIPSDNDRDLEEIPEDVKEGLEFVFVKEMTEVLNNSVAEGENIWK